ncbi:uncharacterized protein LOC100834543 [Brachypodium distachyon]|uniref:DUF7866 domain-containing protein n=1 Tax=Brachypodium distachyon TaxID=15368 RepID=A0A0Q3EYQ6_BRADI|nr:uncharacterized protein LOC100834543 [Brachypodium distachyon]KQJ92510.1 hypothetical protein BRADI_4g44145v3 [Brachypodium distachyon]|eukprot:XP_003577122.2 uncharacterized protein LOC100834543 [Brachypodium distachyon]
MAPPPPGRVPLAAASLILILLFQLSAAVAMASGSSSPPEFSSYVPEKRVLYRTLSSSSSPAAEQKEQKVEPAATVAFQPFEVCTGCRCCPPANSSAGCVDMKCCYGINCNLPGKPFGTCAFTPRTCGCTTNDDCPAKQPAP